MTTDTLTTFVVWIRLVLIPLSTTSVCIPSDTFCCVLNDEPTSGGKKGDVCVKQHVECRAECLRHALVVSRTTKRVD